MVTGFGCWRVNTGEEVIGNVGISLCCGSKVEVRYLPDQVLQSFGRLRTRPRFPIDVQCEGLLGVGRDVETDVEALFCWDLGCVIDVCEQIE